MKNNFGAMEPIKHTLFNLKRMFILSWRTDKKLVIGYYLTAGFAAFFSLGISFALKYLIDALVANGSINVSNSIPAIIIVLLGTRYILGVARTLTHWGLNQTYFDYLLRYKLQNKITYLFYQKLANLDIASLEDPKTQDLIAKAKDTMAWRLPDFMRTFSYFFTDLITYISSFIVLLSFGWWIPLIITAINLPYLYIRAKFGSLQWSIYGSGAPQVRKLWYFMWILSEQTAIKEMRIFKSNEALLAKFKDIQDYLFDLNKKPIAKFIQLLPLASIIEVSVLFVIAWTQLPVVLAGLMSIGTFTLLVNMIDSLSGSAGAIVLNFGELYTHSLYVDHYYDVLNLSKVIEEVKHPHIFKKIAPPKIEFKNVSFQYPNGAKVLKDVSFVINPGENVAFVGENGAGKSTIIKLICRFYDVTDGEILINGQNIKNLSLSQWYDFLGTLFQDFVQFHFTARENIALGKPGKQNFNKIREAAEKSGALEFIEKLPKGFDTILGREFEDGEQLSTGQWQKLAIARAFYEEAPVLILDEPTSAIDAEAEFEIFTNLEQAYHNKTLILVSHRFSTVRNANKIIVVQNGEIAEQGTHAELLKLNGKYSRMFTTQAKGYQ